ncbi:MAG TPA: class I SAM-dependent methyltransferase [Caulobacteraceae bacterium]|nr:class I SAM-dependent methyltransferase [Caulobacteraceae bacterium]
MAGGAPLLLDVGCGEPGSVELPGAFAAWRRLRIDIDPQVAPDIVASAADLSAVPSGVADAVWTAHCIEHLWEHEVDTALAEFRRVLKADGFACILVPDLQRVAELVAQDRLEEVIYDSPAGPVRPHDVIFGLGAALAHGHAEMGHRCGFTPASLQRHLRAAGFEGWALLRRPGFELAAVARARDWPSRGERDALLKRLGL